MRTSSEIHERLLERLLFALHRPEMMFGDVDAAEGMFLHLLESLCFIDEQEEESTRVCSRFIVGCRWVRGHFEFQHKPFPKYVNEVTSVYAEVAHKLGYFNPPRLLTEADMANLVSVVEKPEFTSHNVTEPELHARFGEPSHMVLGGLTTVTCYGCEKADLNWVHFDFARKLPWDSDWLPIPLLRDYRIAESYNRMHLMPMGQRWANEGSAPPSES